MDPLDMIAVCSQCYNQMRYNSESSKRLRENRCCDSQQHQWDEQNSVTTVMNESGLLQQIRPLPSNYLQFHGKFIKCNNDPCTRHNCTYAHDNLELQAWNKLKTALLCDLNKQPPQSLPFHQPPRPVRSISQVSSAACGGLTNINHQDEYELLPEDELDEDLLEEPLSRENYVDKFHTLLYYEEHEHARVLEDRCDKSLKISLYKSRGEMCGSLVGLDSNDLVYIQQAATNVEITIDRTTVRAEIVRYSVSKKGQDVINVTFDDDDENAYYCLKSKVYKKAESRTVFVHFILKHSYFRDLHKSLDRVNLRIIDCLIPDALQPDQNDLPSIRKPDSELFELDKEYQLLALKKLMACNTIAPFLLTGPFGTGKTKILATAAVNFLRKRSNRVLICTSHMQSADAYIDKYFGPYEESLQSYNVNPVRVASKRYRYSGKYDRLFKRKGCSFEEKREIKRSRLIITTFLTAPYLIDLRVRYFTHILIDEGAQTREPETIAPLGLADENTKIVIAGDHLQIGPQMLVLGDKALHNGLGQSLLQRLHILYNKLLENPTTNPHSALLLTNYRCHDSIMRLPSNLFFESTLHMRAQNSKLHPKTSSALEFFCTSMDSSVVASKDDYSEEEAIVTLEQVKFYVDPWPDAQWGDEADLSTICVMASSRNQVRMLRKLLRQKRFREIKDVQALATYELQGREFRAIFISTLEVTNKDGSTRNPTKSICDQYTFNTIITRAQSLIVCVGNPFLLFSIETHAPKYGNREAPIYCWREYVNRCMETKAFHLAPQCHKMDESILQENIKKLQNEVFENLQRSLDSPSSKVHEVSDSILNAYKLAFQSHIACKDVKVKLGSVNGDRCYVLQESDSHTANEPEPDFLTNDASIECYLESITFRKAIATPLDPSQPSITINGVDNRRGALDGSLVKVALYKDVDHCGKVCEVIEQGPQRQFVCSVDTYNSIFFCPIDRKSPKLVNLPGLSREVLDKKAFNKFIIKKELEYKQRAVAVFDPQSFTNPNKQHSATMEIPQIKDVIPLNIAQKLLFIVWYLRWKPKYRYPLGVVIAAIPRGLTLYHAERMLLAHYNINIASVSSADGDLNNTNSMSTLPRYDHALTIDPSDAKVLDDALTLEPLSSKVGGQRYRLGVHIANVARILKGNTEIDRIARERGTAVYGSKFIPLFYPMLPKKVRKSLSLSYNKETLTISITCIVSVGKDIKIDDIKVRESCVSSGARLTYEDARCLLDGVKNDRLDNLVRDYNRTLSAGSASFGLEQRLAVLLQISEFLFRYRTQSDDIHYTIEEEEVLLSSQAHFLVEEMMIWANRIAAEHVLAAFPKLTLLRSQKSPNRDRLMKALQQYEDAINFSPIFESLACDLKINITPGPYLLMELFRKQLLGALQSGDIKQASNLLRVTSYHPQLAVLSREVNGSKSRAQYVCSGDLQEQEKPELQRGKYLVSLTDAQKEVYGHYDQGCLYTHFTSPLRRYIDIVMQRLILQSLSSSVASRDLYTVEELRSICTECNATTLNANKFQREFNRLSLALSLAECSQTCTAYVASIEKSLQLIIRELDCQFLSSNQCSFRLSNITKGTTPSGTGAEGSKSKSYVWKAKVTSFTRKYEVDKFASVKEHPPGIPSSKDVMLDAMITFYSDEATISTNTTHDDLSTALVQHCYDAEFVDKPQSLDMEEWKKIAEFMKQPSEHTATQLEELLISHNPTEDGDGVKFPTNASFWLYEVKQSFEAYKCFKIQLAASFSDYILSPCIQLLEVAPMLNVCVQHSTNPASCFSTPILSDASRKDGYNDINEYINLWKNVLLAEAAVQSVSGDAEIQLIKNVPLKWPALEQPSTSLDDIYYSPVKSSDKKQLPVTLTIPVNDFGERCGEYFDIQVGNLVCARYNIPLYESTEHVTEVKGRNVQSANAVYHFVIDGIKEKDSTDMPKAVNKKQKSTSMKKKKYNHSDQIISLKIVSSEAGRVSSFMKPHLEKSDSTCEIQVISLDLPYKRMYRSLCTLEYTDRNSLCQEIALGKALKSKRKTTQRNILTTTTLIMKDKLVLSLWPHCQQQLNSGQEHSVMTSIQNKFQLIQGPPGTGKSVTGAHLAYAFIVANHKLHQPSKTGKIKCVMYCGPSNKSIDVVLNMFLNHPNIKDLRILRIYSKSIETKYYYGPHSSKVHSKPLSDQECDKNHEKFALHVKIRSKDCSLSTTILKMEEKFKRYSEEQKLPSSLEKRKYNDFIKDAEEEMIRAGDYDIVLCTCNEACSVRVVDNIEPTHLIIDEAAMATEPEAMIPIQLADHVTLIGDHMQLQPVITYNPAKEKGLGRSLFQRYAEKDKDLLMLTTQYRMHAKICEFPSAEFYEGKLVADSSVSQQFCKLEGFWPRGPHCPIVFCDVEGKEDREEDLAASSHHKVHQESKSNRKEAEKIVEIITILNSLIKDKLDHKMKPLKIAVLTPYKAQKALVKQVVDERKLNVGINTINESQGSEYDFVIFSTVRSMPRHIIRNEAAIQPDRTWLRENLGFITDRHQICVGITRARHGLIIVGNAVLLSYDKTWRNLLTSYDGSWDDKMKTYKGKGCIVEANNFPPAI